MSTSTTGTFSIVAAILNDRGIGYKNTLPWPSLKKDYDQYIRLTSTPKVPGKKCVNIKGRLTWESTGFEEKSNPNIINVVVSDTLSSCPEYVSHVVRSFEAALELAWSPPLSSVVDSVWVMGGQSIYEVALRSPQCNRVYLTRINAQYPCDTFLPEFEDHFLRVEDPEVENTPQKDNGIPYQFEVYQRK